MGNQPPQAGGLSNVKRQTSNDNLNNSNNSGRWIDHDANELAIPEEDLAATLEEAQQLHIANIEQAAAVKTEAEETAAEKKRLKNDIAVNTRQLAEESAESNRQLAEESAQRTRQLEEEIAQRKRQLHDEISQRKRQLQEEVSQQKRQLQEEQTRIETHFKEQEKRLDDQMLETKTRQYKLQIHLDKSTQKLEKNQGLRAVVAAKAAKAQEAAARAREEEETLAAEEAEEVELLAAVQLQEQAEKVKLQLLNAPAAVAAPAAIEDSFKEQRSLTFGTDAAGDPLPLANTITTVRFSEASEETIEFMDEGHGRSSPSKNRKKMAERTNDYADQLKASLAFNRFDRDKDGVLNRSEVRSLAESMLAQQVKLTGRLSDDEIELIMRCGGTEAKPVITKEEIPMALATVDLMREHNRELTQLFTMFDKDENGLLSANELGRLLTHVNAGTPPTKADMTYILRQCEPRNVDDPIHLKELTAALACWYVLLSKPSVPDEMKEMFSECDEDASGQISRQDLMRTLCRLNPSMDLFSEADWVELFKHTDKNGDGKIDYCDFVDWLMSDEVINPEMSKTANLSINDETEWL